MLHRVRDAQAFAKGTELVPFARAGHGGTFAVYGEVAKGEDELWDVGGPSEDNCVLGVVAAAAENSFGRGAPIAVDGLGEAERSDENRGHA
jgi:hypothetical protein